MAFLSNPQLIRINKVIDNLNIKYDFNFPDTSIMDVSKSLKISLKEAEFKEDDIAGLIDYGSDSEQPTIFINGKDGDKKRNFTIAHEIGHLLLHRDTKVRYKVDRHNFENLSEKDWEEEEADYFAGELLVPSHKLKEIIFKYRMQEWDLINFCSQYFNVSKSVIVNRLKWLKV